MAKSVCFGFISLKWVLILIALIDITLGVAAIAIGVLAYLRVHMQLSMIGYVFINSMCTIFAFLCLYAISK